jgi:type II secretion system protein G
MMKFMARRLSRSEEGFTLIELLVVVAIIALLATFAVPKLFDAINKSKKAPGQADLQTISGALERYYMDNNTYPTGAAATVQSNLTGTYIKNTTSFTNGFKQGYLYGTDSTGSGYVLIDTQGATVGATITVTCGANPYTFTPSSTGLSVNAAILTADLATCAAPANMAAVKN